MTYDELDQALRAVGVKLTYKELDLLCKDIDVDKNGSITYPEFAGQVIAHHHTKVAVDAAGKKKNAIKELL